MNRRFQVAGLLLALLVGGCGSDPTSEEPPGDFEGTWILTSTIIQKTACESETPRNTLVEQVVISQSGSIASLTFEDYTASGTVAHQVLSATGTLPTGEDVDFEFTRVADGLEGTVRIVGDGCMEVRDAILSRRSADRDFSGHWGLSLTVTGAGGCEHIQDYDDCFRIIQTGTDLLVVDDDAGNLLGGVLGNVAEIVRDTEDETTSLIFYMGPSGTSITGNAVRVFHEVPCRTDLVFCGAVRELPCADATH